MTDSHTLSLQHALAAFPERVAVLAEGRAISYRQLARDAAHILDRLASGGVGPSVSTAIRAEARYGAIVALHARIAIGAPIVPLHTRWSAQETDLLLANDQAIYRLPPTLLTADRSHAGPDSPGNGTDDGPGYGLSTAIPDDDRDLAWIATSGTTTGRPRWVVLSRAALAAAVTASADNLGWAESDRWLLSLPLAHVGGLSILLRCLSGRVSVVLEDLVWQRPEGILRQIRAREVTLLSLVPTQLARLLTVPGPAPPRLRAILVGGAAAAPRLLDRALDRGWPVLATYGSTETCSQIATWRCPEPLSRPLPSPLPRTTPELAKTRPRPAADHGCGPPLPGTRLRIAEDGRIEVSGANMMTGYRPLDGPQPFTTDGWLRTHDRGRIDEDGNLHVLGRADDVIVSGGENIDPLEVERVLQAHQAITDALVFGAIDPLWGQCVSALLVAADIPAEDAAVKAHLRTRLATFKHPRQIAWVEALPQTDAGKPDRTAAAGAGAALRPLGGADSVGRDVAPAPC